MYVKQACPNKGPKQASYIEIRKFIIKTVPLPKAKHLTKLKKKKKTLYQISVVIPIHVLGPPYRRCDEMEIVMRPRNLCFDSKVCVCVF